MASPCPSLRRDPHASAQLVASRCNGRLWTRDLDVSRRPDAIYGAIYMDATMYYIGYMRHFESDSVSNADVIFLI